MTNPNQPPPLPPQNPRPPAVPAIPLQYSAGEPAALSSVGSQLAKASWVAPLVAMVLGCFGNMAQTSQRATSSAGAAGDQMASIIIGFINIALVLGGLAMGIIALAGMKRWGRDKVLVPAIWGVVINSLFILLILALIPSLTRARATAVAVAAKNASAQSQAQIAQMKKDGEDSFYHDGWFGVYNNGSTVVTISDMPEDSPLTAQLHASVPGAWRVGVLTVRNGTSSPIDVDTRKSIFYYADGTHEPGLDSLAILQAAVTDREQVLKTFAPPYHLEAGQNLLNGLIFFPVGMNFSRLSRVTVWSNGHALEVPGRIYTSAEKKRLAELGKQKMGGQ